MKASVQLWVYLRSSCFGLLCYRYFM